MLLFLPFFFFFNGNASVTIVKRNGDNESPCLNPLEAENHLVGDPLTRAEKDDEEIHS